MSEINRKKVAKVMAGYDFETGDLKAYNLQNTIIMGRTGSGVSNILNNVLLNLIQNHSPNEVCVQYFSSESDIPWLMKARKIPHFVNQSYPEVPLPEHDYTWYIKEITKCLRALVNREYEDGMLSDRHNVIIVEVTKDMYNCKSLRLAIELLAKCTKELPYDHLFLVTDSYLPELVKIENCFGLRIITRVDEMLSNAFLGCNLATLEKEKYGFAWVTEKDNFYVKRRLLVPFKPIPYFTKVCKYLSTGINNSYDAYRAEWEHYCEHDEDNDCFLLWKDANQWNVTPIDDSEEYNKMIKDYSHVQLCEEILKGMNEYAYFTRETEEYDNEA